MWLEQLAAGKEQGRALMLWVNGDVGMLSAVHYYKIVYMVESQASIAMMLSCLR